MTKQIATFAGGCFWCMVKPFDQQRGIERVVSGYTGGTVENPTYEQVCSETTGHYEAVQIIFDDAIYPYEKLVEVAYSRISNLNEIFDLKSNDYKQFIDAYGLKYNYLLNNQVDEKRSMLTFLRNLKNGEIKKISWEKPDDFV